MLSRLKSKMETRTGYTHVRTARSVIPYVLFMVAGIAYGDELYWRDPYLLLYSLRGRVTKETT